MFDFRYDSIIENTEKSLEKLKIKYADMVFAHDVEFGDLNTIFNETLPALQCIKDSGKAKYIGISGYSLKTLNRINIDAILTYSRYVLFDETLNEIIEFFKEREIFIVSGSPTGMGLLTQNGPPSWHPAHTMLKDRCQKVSVECEKNQINISELAIKHVINNRSIDMVLIGPKNINEMRNCVQAVNTPLSDEECNFITRIKSLYFDDLDVSVRSWEGVEKAHLIERKKG
ncbi:L-galactose dehydrogenase [Thelohanellus kitauei]|uniref:L-galactose dehydrogenase n=1 Tax=Thelohanellus kitauei TaxID=669202 RepID=A0A0C2MVZ2_THEKT|nr:L-galactose dehydrogenase [Thelohanellus kitauei]